MENIVKSEKETRTPIEVMLGMTEDGLVSSKKLYEFLELAPAAYSRWCKRNIVESVVAIEDEDYYTSESRMVDSLQPSVENPIGGRPSTDYLLTIDFAKSLCMIANTERGRQAREYFRKTEKALVVTIKEYNLLRDRVEQLGSMYEKKINELEKLALDTAARLDCKEGGSTFADSNEEHWIHDTYESVKRLAQKRGMSVADCLTDLVEEMDRSNQLGYSYAEMARAYKSQYPDRKAERLAVLSQDLDSQLAFEYVLYAQMDYWEVFDEEERKGRKLLIDCFGDVEYAYCKPREAHVDTEDPGFLAAMEALDRLNKEEEEMERCRSSV